MLLLGGSNTIKPTGELIECCLHAHKRVSTTGQGSVACMHACRSANYELAQALYERCRLQQPQDVQILSNLAAVHLRLENWLEALKHAQIGLDIVSQHIKCLYRHGVAATNLGQHIRAICDLGLAQKLVMPIVSAAADHVLKFACQPYSLHT